MRIDLEADTRRLDGWHRCCVRVLLEVLQTVLGTGLWVFIRASAGEVGVRFQINGSDETLAEDEGMYLINDLGHVPGG